MVDSAVGRLADQVAAEEKPRLDSVLLQEADEVVAGERRILANGDQEPEPARVAALGRTRQDQDVLERRSVPPAAAASSASGRR